MANIFIPPGIHYQESSGRSGWYNIEGDRIIVSLKQAGNLYRRRYQVEPGEARAVIDAYVSNGTLPDIPEICTL
jgi:hypothetical protein